MHRFLTSLLLSRKKYYATAFCLGIVATLALPPVYLLPAIVPAFTGLLILLELTDSRKQAFWAGWWFGFGHFLTGLYWITFAILKEADKFWWLVPIAVLAISAVLAIYIALVTLLTHRLPATRLGKVILLASLWVGMEYLRAHLFTGFPWNLIGYTWTISTPMMQLAAITGIYGLSFLTVLVGAIPMARRYPPAISVLVIVALIWACGTWRLAQSPTEYVPNVQLRLVQGSIPQDQKWDPSYRLEVLDIYRNLSQQPASTPITHLLWPETAIPFLVQEDAPVLDILKDIVPPHGYLLTGALRTDTDAQGTPRYWNTFQVINDNGEIAATYNKFHLVPFGEYIPLRGFLPFAQKITHGAIDFSTGPGPQTLTLQNIPAFSPLICYEGIFPGNIIAKDTPPQWIVNVTNDAWFGDTSGPYQHFQMVRMRAVEQGMPIVRVANNGISGVIDSYGRIIISTSLNARTVLDSKLPVHITTTTLYSKMIDIYLLLIVFFLCIIVVLRKKFLPST